MRANSRPFRETTLADVLEASGPLSRPDKGSPLVLTVSGWIINPGSHKTHADPTTVLSELEPFAPFLERFRARPERRKP